MALLALLLVLGVAGNAFRSRFAAGTPPFYVISVALVPVAVGAIAILARMVSVYRTSRGSAGSAATPVSRGRRE